jgi:hypothetical protein
MIGMRKRGLEGMYTVDVDSWIFCGFLADFNCTAGPRLSRSNNRAHRSVAMNSNWQLRVLYTGIKLLMVSP